MRIETGQIKVNRFGEIVGSFDFFFGPAELSRIVTGAVKEIQKIARYWLERESPELSFGHYMTTGHDHTPIYQGWVSGPIESRYGFGGEGGVRGGARSWATIGNKSEHINVQRSGTTKKNYRIPASPDGSVTFWLGPPLVWPVRSPRIPGDGRFFRFREVTHPGIKPWGGSDFAERAINNAFPDMNRAFESAMDAARAKMRERGLL